MPIALARQCLGYILTNKYGQGLSHVGRMLGVGHATIIHGNKRVSDAVYVMDKRYVQSLNFWRVVFDENEMFIHKNTNDAEIVKARIIEAIEDAISDGVLGLDEINDFLKELLINFEGEGVSEEEVVYISNESKFNQ